MDSTFQTKAERQRTMNNKKNAGLYLSYLWLILAQLTTGINITTSKYLLGTFNPVFLLFSRFLIATALLFVLHYLRKTTGFVTKKQKLRDLTRRDWVFIIAQALCAGVMFNFLLLLGLHYTDASSAGIITSTLPAIVAVMAIIFLRERLTFFTGLCVSFAVAGLFVMNIDKVSTNFSSGLIGDAIIFLAILPEAAYYIMAKVYNSELPVFLLAGLINGINFFIMLLIILLTGHFPHHAFTTMNIFILLASGVSSALFYTFWFLGCRQVSGSTAGLFTTMMPLSTLLLAWLFLDEKITLLQFVGMGLVITSIIINAENPIRRKRKNPQAKLP